MSVAEKAYVDPALIADAMLPVEPASEPFSSRFTRPPYPEGSTQQKLEWTTIPVGDDVISFSVTPAAKGHEKTILVRVEVPSTIIGRATAKVVYARMTVTTNATKAAFDVVTEYQGVNINEQRRGRILNEIRKLLTAQGVDPMISIIVVVGRF